MIFNGFFDSCALALQDRKGKAASWARKLRRAIVFTPDRGITRESALTLLRFLFVD
jgi:hypothetical protein